MISARVADPRHEDLSGPREGDGEGGVRAPSGADIAAGETMLAVENVSLAFGGMKAITRRLVRHP